MPQCHHEFVRRDECSSATMESYAGTSAAVPPWSRTDEKGGGISDHIKSGTDSEQCRGLGKQKFRSGEAARA